MAMDNSTFWWATGIEDTFIPQERPGLRALDEYALTQHYEQWRTDFDLAADTGVMMIRWGIPWYRVQPAADRWDWAWTDAALDYMVNVKRLTPILDLMHYGTPLWLADSFANPDYPQRVADYAAAVAARYGSLVRYYTPLNEPMVNAEFCGLRGEWPPYLTGTEGYLRVALAVARGIVLTVGAWAAATPGPATTVQVEASWRVWTEERALVEKAAQETARQFVVFDLCTGRVDASYPLYGYLSSHGVNEAELDWFRAHAVQFDIFGANFYPWSYTQLKTGEDGQVQRVHGETPGSALGDAAAAAHHHSGLPVMVTETSANADQAGRARWMDESIAAVRTLRAEGVPVVGYTWFPMMTMIDWAYRREDRSLEHYLLDLGLYESRFDAASVLVRRPTPLLDRYRRQMAAAMPAIGGAKGTAGHTASTGKK
jgi:beta-glucosidase